MRGITAKDQELGTRVKAVVTSRGYDSQLSWLALGFEMRDSREAWSLENPVWESSSEKMGVNPAGSGG